MTPLELSICLHYHSSVVDIEWINSGAPIVDETLDRFVSEGLLERGPVTTTHNIMQFAPTQKLHAFVAMLCETPFPSQEWCDPRSGKPVKGVVG